MKRVPNSCLVLAVLIPVVTLATTAHGESPALTVHWGGLAYPDQYSSLTLGYTGNRFTEFDGEGRRYNNIRETMGLNFGSVSWTQHWGRFEGWSTNLTIGAGPTGEQPTRYLQNEFVHDALLGIPRVPVSRTRDEFDFMVDGSVTKWWDLGQSPKMLFAGGGFSSGTLYHEGFVRAGVRRFLIAKEAFKLFGSEDHHGLGSLLKGLGWSGMVRYSRQRSSGAFREVAPRSYLAQTSLSWGIYDDNHVPFFEIESGITLDSGLFTDLKGDSLEERFVSLLTLRIRHFSVETWNDMINRKDNGPTYGARLTIDIYPCVIDFKSSCWEKWTGK